MQSSLARPMRPPVWVGCGGSCDRGNPRGSVSVVRCRAEAAPPVSTAAARAPVGPYTGRDPEVKKPAWLRQRAAQGEKYARLRESIGELKLNTVCVEAQCPNIGEVRTRTDASRFCNTVVSLRLVRADPRQRFLREEDYFGFGVGLDGSGCFILERSVGTEAEGPAGKVTALRQLPSWFSATLARAAVGSAL